MSPFFLQNHLKCHHFIYKRHNHFTKTKVAMRRENKKYTEIDINYLFIY